MMRVPRSFCVRRPVVCYVPRRLKRADVSTFLCISYPSVLVSSHGCRRTVLPRLRAGMHGCMRTHGATAHASDGEPVRLQRVRAIVRAHTALGGPTGRPSSPNIRADVNGDASG